MKLDPKVSIIITCYNQQAFIAQAIESVINQTFSDWECIIVDDGSVDKSAEISNSYSKKDQRIKYNYQPNTGVAAARNNGYAISKGQYIQFLDGDDFLFPEKLNKQLAYMETHSYTDVCYTHHFHYWDSNQKYATYDFEVLEERPLHQFLDGFDNGVSLPIHAALLRRSLWAAGELPFVQDYRYRYEDCVFWVRICLKYARFHFIDEHLVAYRMHDNNFISNPETVAYNAMQSAFYIASLLQLQERSCFLEKKIPFILHRFGQTIALQSREQNAFLTKLRNWIHKLKRGLMN